MAKRIQGFVELQGEKLIWSRNISFEYVVQRGDKLYYIAEKFRSSRLTLMKLNRIRYPDFIRAGMRLKIPLTQGFIKSGGKSLLNS